MNSKPKIPVILGPTAAGKTALGCSVCERLGGEIISADSRQIYKYMDIGTAKPTPEEIQRAPHHLVDFLEPDSVFSAGDFVTAAVAAVEEISARGKLPVIVGGAGLYIRALTQGIFEGKSSDPQLREELMDHYDRGGSEAMLQELRELDPEYAPKVHLNDRKKLVRFFEVYRTTGLTISRLKEKQGDGWIIPLTAGLTLERELLYERIENRVDKMIQNGLIDEVRSLRKMGFGEELNSMNSPGYKEVHGFIERKIDYDEMIESIKRNTRRFAKRQITWFKKEKGVKWFQPDDLDAIIEYIKTGLEIPNRKS